MNYGNYQSKTGVSLAPVLCKKVFVHQKLNAVTFWYNARTVYKTSEFVLDDVRTQYTDDE